MSEGRAIEQAQEKGLLAAIRKYKWWWILPLFVLTIIIIAAYVLSHLSSTDSEMYPTSSREIRRSLRTS